MIECNDFLASSEMFFLDDDGALVIGTHAPCQASPTDYSHDDVLSASLPDSCYPIASNADFVASPTSVTEGLLGVWDEEVRAIDFDATSSDEFSDFVTRAVYFDIFEGDLACVSSSDSEPDDAGTEDMDERMVSELRKLDHANYKAGEYRRFRGYDLIRRRCIQDDSPQEHLATRVIFDMEPTVKFFEQNDQLAAVAIEPSRARKSPAIASCSKLKAASKDDHLRFSVGGRSRGLWWAYLTAEKHVAGKSVGSVIVLEQALALAKQAAAEAVENGVLLFEGISDLAKSTSNLTTRLRACASRFLILHDQHKGLAISRDSAASDFTSCLEESTNLMRDLECFLRLIGDCEIHVTLYHTYVARDISKTLHYSKKVVELLENTAIHRSDHVEKVKLMRASCTLLYKHIGLLRMMEPVKVFKHSLSDLQKLTRDIVQMIDIAKTVVVQTEKSLQV